MTNTRRGGWPGVGLFKGPVGLVTFADDVLQGDDVWSGGHLRSGGFNKQSRNGGFINSRVKMGFYK